MSASLHRLARWMRGVGPATSFGLLADLIGQAHGADAAVFVVDASRHIVYWSPQAERLLGFSAAQMVGHHCLKGNRCESCMIGCGVMEHDNVLDVQLTLHRDDDVPVQVRKTARALRAEDGSFLGAIEILMPARAAADAGGASQPDTTTALMADGHTFHGMVSRDPAMISAFDITRNVAETDATVLVRGESGTGKELVARALHAESQRNAGPFRAVNCAALSPTLLESELFGHVRGAFTGAVRDRPGLFQQAHGGTLFLDEVAELPMDLQAKLLRVLQERVVVPVGSEQAIEVDIRVVAATHRALRQRVRDGGFREDLMYRLRVVPLYLPPLRDRPGDVELLLWHFISGANDRGPRRISSVHHHAMRALLDHAWPGNVRELQNVVQYAFAVGRGRELLPGELPPELRAPRASKASAPKPTQPLPEDEPARIREALRQAGGHVGQAAEMLGMSRPTFWRRRKRYGI